jgi:hypothetical protein
MVKNENRSPGINHVSWGRLEVEGRAEPYKDAKLFPGGSREWNWRETGTNHVPGIQPTDVQELLDPRMSCPPPTPRNSTTSSRKKNRLADYSIQRAEKAAAFLPKSGASLSSEFF